MGTSYQVELLRCSHTKALLFSKKWHILAKIPVLGNLTHKLSNRLAPFHCSTLLSPTLRLNTLALVREGFKNQFHRICLLEEGTTPAPPKAIFPKKTSRKSQRKGEVPLVLLTIINQCYANHTWFPGRYGDPLNPWGDIITVAETWCASTPDVSLCISSM